MNIDISGLGLKTNFNFKETHIPTSLNDNDIQKHLREKIGPTIRELESNQLINGFHHLVHKDIDLRLSCNNWNEDESKIKKYCLSIQYLTI